MKLDITSWHSQLYKLTYGKTPPTNLCPYFWKLVLAMIFFIPNFIITLPIKIGIFIDRKRNKFGHLDFFDGIYKEHYFSPLPVQSILFTFVMLWIYAMLTMFFHPIHQLNGKMSGIWAFGIIGWGIVGFLALCLGAGFLHEYIQDKKANRKEKSPNLFTEMIKAKYNKYCPQIEWINKSK